MVASCLSFVLRMGKEGDLWDDSALINAFDHAISTYKKMHKGKNKDSSTGADGEIVMGTSTEQNWSNLDSARDAEEKSNIPDTDAPDSDETSSVSKLEQSHRVESQLDQTCLDSTSGQGIQSEQNAYAYAQGWDDYNQLVAQYNELEEKRQKICEQLKQYSGWNYQYAGAPASSSGVPYSNAPDYSMSAYQVSDPNVVCTCCPCYSTCLLSSCTSAPDCSVGGSCVEKHCNHQSVEIDHKMLFPCEDGKIREMAMDAAERALSTIRTTMSADANINEEEKRKNSEPEQISGSETDLTAVLNAWYSAGFYTGKYLAEQSIANRRQK